MKITKVFLVLLGLILFSACGKKEETNKNNINEVIPVEVQKVKTQNIEKVIEAIGTLNAWKEANLGAQTTGRVLKIYVEEGNRVKQGDLLFEMDDTQLAQAKIQLQVTKDNYERLKPLYETGSISKSQFDQVKAAYETAEKSYELLLTNTQFRAPFSGIISAKKLNEGEVFLLAPGGAGSPTIVSLVQINPLKLLINVSERYIRDIKLNQQVNITSDIYPEENFIGTVSRINPTINAATRTFEVEVKISNNNEKLRPGMFVRATINLGRYEGLVIPRSSALKLLGTANYYGFIANGDVAKRVELTLGRSLDENVEIINGLKAGDLIVTTGQGLLKDGNKISIKATKE
jgi:RND family efflux transporter MFP subunit